MFKGLKVSAAGQLCILCPKRTLIGEARNWTLIREDKKNGRRLNRHYIGRRFGGYFIMTSDLDVDMRNGRRLETGRRSESYIYLFRIRK